MSIAPPATNRDREGAHTSTYLITFVCYGSWLPGQPGAVDRTQNVFGTPLPQASTEWESRARSRMRQEPYWLDAMRRQVVLGSLQQVCIHRQWSLLAAHVRSNHAHVVVSAWQSAEQVRRAPALGAAREHTASVDEGSDRVGRSLCGRRTGRSDGGFRDGGGRLMRGL